MSDPTVPHRPSRTGLEMGLVFSVVGMMLGLAFNAGIQYAHISNLESRTGALETEYNALHDREANDNSTTSVQLAHISTQLEQMQKQQQLIQQAVQHTR